MVAFTKLQTRISPTTRFAFLSLVLIGLIAVGLSLVISYYLQIPANTQKGPITVALTAFVGTLVLYLSLFRVFRRATLKIEAQHQALGQQNRREVASARQELVATRAQLEEARRMAAVGEMVTAVAHGIRNPLANIRAWAQTAMLECRNCHSSILGPKSLAITMSEVDRLEARLKELLQFVGNPERQTESVDLNLVLGKTLEMRAVRIENAAIKVDDQRASSLPPIMGDTLLLEEVLVSLIDNAIEAIPESGGTITLTTGAESDIGGALKVFAEVRDTGIGIQQEELPKILNSFYTTKARGTGLGLAIAKKFTEAYGGALTVSSTPGEGATFRVTFPAQRESELCPH